MLIQPCNIVFQLMMCSFFVGAETQNFLNLQSIGYSSLKYQGSRNQEECRCYLKPVKYQNDVKRSKGVKELLQHDIAALPARGTYYRGGFNAW